MQFPILDFGLDHFTSQPFKCLLCQKYTLHKSYTKNLNLSKLSVDSMVDPVAEWVDMGHSETESTELTIYISMADSVKFRWSLELFLIWLTL